jgi:hypothetical protein
MAHEAVARRERRHVSLISLGGWFKYPAERPFVVTLSVLESKLEDPLNLRGLLRGRRPVKIDAQKAGEEESIKRWCKQEEVSATRFNNESVVREFISMQVVIPRMVHFAIYPAG